MAVMRRACALSWVSFAMAEASSGKDFAHLKKRSGKQGWVDDHNHFRGLHGAGKVTWDSDLEKKAKKQAKKMNKENALSHSDSYNDWPASGENVAMGAGSSCSASDDPEGKGGAKLYDGGYDQHCAMATWYAEYYNWKGKGDWKEAHGIGHFSAIVWKGVDAIGCASDGHYHVCEYGSKHCKKKESKGGADCWGSQPSHLPNFNQGQCSGGKCIQGLFHLATDLKEDTVAGTASMFAIGAGVTMLLAGAVLVGRGLRAHALVTGRGDQELLCTSPETGLED